MQRRRKFPWFLVCLPLLALAGGAAFLWWKDIPAPQSRQEVPLPAEQFLRKE